MGVYIIQYAQDAQQHAQEDDLSMATTTMMSFTGLLQVCERVWIHCLVTSSVL